MKSKQTQISSRNVIDDLGFSPEESAQIKLKTELHSEILRAVEEHGLSARQLEKVLDQPQPRISELLRGKISKMSVDKLTVYLFLLGKRVKMVTEPRPLSPAEKERLAA